MRNKKSKKKPHKKKSFKKKSKKTIKSKNKKNIDGLLNDDIFNNPYFNIGMALGDENGKCICNKNEDIDRIIDTIGNELDSFMDTYGIK